MRRFSILGLFGLALALFGVLWFGPRRSIEAQPQSTAIASNVTAGAFPSLTDENYPSRIVFYMPPPEMTAAQLKTRSKLLEKIPMNFPNGTPLKDFLKYIEEATTDKTDFPDGMPVYVDPMGLVQSDKTMDSTIEIQLKHLPLATTLRLALAQLGLVYYVNKEGLVIITSSESEEAIPTQGQIDQEILSNLSELRREIKELREEVRANRAGDKPVAEPTVRLPKMPPGGGSM